MGNNTSKPEIPSSSPPPSTPNQPPPHTTPLPSAFPSPGPATTTPPQSSALQQTQHKPSSTTTDTNWEIEEARSRTLRAQKLGYYGAFALVFACPAVALVPPRKLDLFSLGLGLTWCFSAGYVVEQKTGKGLLWYILSTLPSVRKKEAERLERERENERFEGVKWKGYRNGMDGARKRRGAEEEKEGEDEDEWMTDRARAEREALEEGRGYSGLIMDQVQSVWAGFGKKEDLDRKMEEEEEMAELAREKAKEEVRNKNK